MNHVVAAGWGGAGVFELYLVFCFLFCFACWDPSMWFVVSWNCATLLFSVEPLSSIERERERER